MTFGHQPDHHPGRRPAHHHDHSPMTLGHEHRPHHHGLPYQRHAGPRRWTDPAPLWFNETKYKPLLVPRADRTLAQQCAHELLRQDYCQGNESCQLGVVYAMDPSIVELGAAQGVDAADFVSGAQMQHRCMENAHTNMTRGL